MLPKYRSKVGCQVPLSQCRSPQPHPLPGVSLPCGDRQSLLELSVTWRKNGAWLISQQGAGQLPYVYDDDVVAVGSNGMGGQILWGHGLHTA